MRLIPDELDDEEYVMPPILTSELVRDSRKPLVHAIREHKHYLSERAGMDVGWTAAEKDFTEKGYVDLWGYGFKYGRQSKPSAKVNPDVISERCQDFEHFAKMQVEAAQLTMLEITRRDYVDIETERELFNIYQAKYWRGGFREGFCGFVCPRHGKCENSLKLILLSEPDAVKKSKIKWFSECWVGLSLSSKYLCT